MDTAKLEKTVEKLQKTVEGHDKKFDDQNDNVEKVKNALHEVVERVGKDDKREAIQYTNTKMKDVYAVLKAMGEKIKKLEEAASSEPRPR